MRGHEAFKDYVRSVRGALGDYHCEILDCVAEGNRAFARMRFSGFIQGLSAYGQARTLAGGHLVPFRGGAIAELWDLGDLNGLDEFLRELDILILLRVSWHRPTAASALRPRVQRVP